ncbi:MAG: hypothetical protein RIQ79_983 [Verrucomicrobiota bacterium]|jgi:hypothetical protein
MSVPSIPKLLATSALAATCLGTGFFLGQRQAGPSGPAGPPSATFSANPPAPRLQTAPSARTNDTAAVSSVAREQWATLRDLPSTPDSEAKLCARLEALAAEDPAAALQLATSAATPRQHELLRNAALQGWASRDSLAAADWALANVRSEERRAAVEAIAAGAVARPDDAIAAINHLIAADPILACDHGYALVTALAHVGLYERAGEFAASGPAQYRSAWLASTYQQWGTYQPQAALLALEEIADPVASQEARSGLYAGWSGSDPAALVAYAQTLPHGESRLSALNDGLSQWVHRDPAAASAWMDGHDPSPDLDSGAVAIALAPALVTQKPDVAASWAESITDPELRANTLLDLIRLWAEHDVAGARAYAVRSPALRPETRALALATLEPAP